MKKLIFTILLAGVSSWPVHACVTCDERLQHAIYDERLLPGLLLMLSAFLAVGLIVIILTAVALHHSKDRIPIENPGALTSVPLTATAMVLGIGLGGFADGVLLHQVLQWHEMLSARVPVNNLQGKSVNMFWDGIFHLLCLLITVIGVWLLWKIMRSGKVDRSGQLLSGGMLLGWGTFNLVEGVINHQVLNLHNVKEGSLHAEAWNFAFLGISLCMLAGGAWLVRKRNNSSPERERNGYTLSLIHTGA